MDLIERFRYLMKLEQLSASAFADEIGVQRSSVSHILSGRNKPSLEFIQKVLLKFPKVDANWLINGVTRIKKQELPKEETALEIQEAAEVGLEQKSDGTKNKLKTSPAEQTEKKIERILIFYEDRTFEEYTS